MCPDRHARRHAFRRRRLPGRITMLVACAVLAFASPSFAVSPRADRVVWHDGDSFYVATADSGSLAPGMEICLTASGREVACGVVTRVLDGVVASVRRTRGDFDPESESLGGLEVHVAPAAARRFSTLRLGLPAARRDGRAFACPDARLDPAVLPRAYRLDTLASATFRFVALDSALTAHSWPETLLVHSYADRADEEIALERGEVDVAVFWPGEAPASLRGADSRFAMERGARARGALVLEMAPRDTALGDAAGPDLEALNRQVFAGDLGPWSDARPTSRGGDARRLRYVVDPGLPGQRVIARALEARRPATASGRAVTLAYRDVDVTNPDSLARASRPRGVLPVFTMRCTLHCRAELAGTVRALGPGVFADLLRCGGAERPR